MRVDAFLFNNELDLLELRFNALDPVMDRFVVVESTVTFAGKPKPLSFRDNAGRFSQWKNKITHVIVSDTPDSGADRWAREFHQRNAIMRGMSGLKSNDLIFLSDVDEIPDSDAVRTNRHGGYHQVYSMYYANAIRMEENWVGTLALYLFQFKQLGMQGARNDRYKFHRVDPGGWHFAYLMTEEEIHEKLKAFAHSEWDKEEIHVKMGHRMAWLEDLFGAHKTPLKHVDISTGYFPEYLKQNCGSGQKFFRFNCTTPPGTTGPTG